MLRDIRIALVTILFRPSIILWKREPDFRAGSYYYDRADQNNLSFLPLSWRQLVASTLVQSLFFAVVQNRLKNRARSPRPSSITGLSRISRVSCRSVSLNLSFVASLAFMDAKVMLREIHITPVTILFRPPIILWEREPDFRAVVDMDSSFDRFLLICHDWVL